MSSKKIDRIPLMFMLVYADKSAANKYVILMFDSKQNLTIKTKRFHKSTKSLTLSNIRSFDRMLNGYQFTKNTQIAFSKDVLQQTPIWIYLSTICRYTESQMYDMTFDDANNAICKMYKSLRKCKIEGFYRRGMSRYHKTLGVDMLWERMCEKELCPWINYSTTKDIHESTSVKAIRHRLKKAYICLYFMFIRKHNSIKRATYKASSKKLSKTV